MSGEPSCRLYQTLYFPDAGWVIFRCDPDVTPTTDIAREHKQAVFVGESAAIDYCLYRNRLVDINGDDSLPNRSAR